MVLRSASLPQQAGRSCEGRAPSHTICPHRRELAQARNALLTPLSWLRIQLG